MNCLLDTSFLAAHAINQDANNKRAHELGKELIHNKLIVLDYVFSEFVTLLRSRLKDPLAAARFGDAILYNPRFEVQRTDSTLFLDAWSVFADYTQLSFTDAILVAYARKSGIHRIVSFDKDFDVFEFIQRIY